MLITMLIKADSIQLFYDRMNYGPGQKNQHNRIRFFKVVLKLPIPCIFIPACTIYL